MVPNSSDSIGYCEIRYWLHWSFSLCLNTSASRRALIESASIRRQSSCAVGNTCMNLDHGASCASEPTRSSGPSACSPSLYILELLTVSKSTTTKSFPSCSLNFLSKLQRVSSCLSNGCFALYKSRVGFLSSHGLFDVRMLGLEISVEVYNRLVCSSNLQLCARLP